MRVAGVFLFVLAGGGQALGQVNPGSGEILIESTGPEAHHERRRVPLPPEGPEREAFLREFITVDPIQNEVRLAGKDLSAHDFYTRLDRPDLVARADERSRQKTWLLVGGGVVAVASVVAGILVINSAKDTNTPACSVDVFTKNACLDSNSKTTTAGAILLVAGIAVGTGLMTWGALIPTMVTPRQETLQLATEHNFALSRKHGGEGARLQILPTLAPGHAGLVARLTF